MTSRKKTALYWILGIATAFAGVAIARLVAPHYEIKTAAYVGAAGHLLALAGLVIIAFGVRQRVWKKGAEGNAEKSVEETSASKKTSNIPDE